MDGTEKGVDTTPSHQDKPLAPARLRSWVERAMQSLARISATPFT